MRPGTAVVLALAWLVAFNLRSGFIGLGPALPALTVDLGLSFAQAGFLVAVPTLMMGLMAVPGGALVDRWGPARVITAGLALVAVGGGLRAIAPEFVLLLALTFLFGAGIGSRSHRCRGSCAHVSAASGCDDGGLRFGLVTGSIIAASLTGPILDRIGEPAAWRLPLLLWGMLAGIALIDLDGRDASLVRRARRGWEQGSTKTNDGRRMDALAGSPSLDQRVAIRRPRHRLLPLGRLAPRHLR